MLISVSTFSGEVQFRPTQEQKFPPLLASLGREWATNEYALWQKLRLRRRLPRKAGLRSSQRLRIDFATER
jgi:hypothetical protein